MLARTLLLTLALTACAQPGSRRDIEDAADDRTTTRDEGTTTGTTDTTTAGTTGTTGGTTGTTGMDRPGTTGMDDEDRGAMANTYTPMIDPTARDAKPVDHLVAVVHGTEKNPNVHGELHLRRSGEGVQVEVEMDALPSGTYVAAVHTYGDCSNPDGQSAGPGLDFHQLASAFGPGGMRDDMKHEGMKKDDMGGMGPRDATGSGTLGGTPGGATGTGTTGAPGADLPEDRPEDRPGSIGQTGAAEPGNLGTFTATNGKVPRQTMTLPMLKDDQIGLLNGRSIVLERTAMAGTTPGAIGGEREVVGCGVFGVARETTTPIAPTMTSPEAEEDAITRR